MYVKNNILLIRKRWRLTLERFGEITGANKGKISSYERGTAEPNLEFVAKLYELSGISIYELITTTVDIGRIPDDPLDQLPSSSENEMVKPSTNNQIPTESLSVWIKQMEQRMKNVEDKLENKE